MQFAECASLISKFKIRFAKADEGEKTIFKDVALRLPALNAGLARSVKMLSILSSRSQTNFELGQSLKITVV